MTVHSAAQSLDVFLPAFLPQVIHPGFHAFALLQVETEGGSLKWEIQAQELSSWERFLAHGVSEVPREGEALLLQLVLLDKLQGG